MFDLALLIYAKILHFTRQEISIDVEADSERKYADFSATDRRPSRLLPHSCRPTDLRFI